MKKTYLQPVTEVIPVLFADYHMNTGTVYSADGTTESTLGAGVDGGGTTGEGGFIWGHARNTDLWEDDDADDSGFSRGGW